MDSYPKDKDLEGVYVKRCKCGARPYHDRIAIYPTPHWIQCNCGRKGKSTLDLQASIDSWNKDELSY